MPQPHGRFTRWTVDEQIDQLAQHPNLTGQQETSDRQLVRRLRRLYQANTAERRMQSLEHGWERIVQIQANRILSTPLSGEQQENQERRLQVMKIQADLSTTPQENELIQVHPFRGPSRFHKLMQTLVAALIVCVLLSGFIVLFATHHAAKLGAKPEHTAPGSSGPVSHPAPHAIVVAVAQDGTVYGFRPDNGTVLWKYATGKVIQGGDDGIHSQLVVQGQVAYFVALDQVYAFNTTNGALLWQQHLAIPMSDYGAIMSDNGVVYVSEEILGGGAVGHMYALQARDGSILWHHQGVSESLVTANNGIVYVDRAGVSGNDTLVALTGSSGELLWSYSIPPETAVATRDTLYISAGAKQNKSIVALRARDGKRFWTTQILDAGVHPLIVDQGVVMVGTTTSGFSTIDVQYCAYRIGDGSKAWCSAKEAGTATASPAYTTLSGAIYTAWQLPASGFVVEARSVSTGKLNWSKTLLSSLSMHEIVGTNGAVYVDAGSRVYALGGTDGHILWQFESVNNSFMSIAAGSW